MRADDRHDKDEVAIVASVVAMVVLSFTSVRDYLFGPHALRASVLRVEEAGDRLRAEILLVNGGKH